MCCSTWPDYKIHNYCARVRAVWLLIECENFLDSVTRKSASRRNVRTISPRRPRENVKKHPNSQKSTDLNIWVHTRARNSHDSELLELLYVWCLELRKNNRKNTRDKFGKITRKQKLQKKPRKVFLKFLVSEQIKHKKKKKLNCCLRAQTLFHEYLNTEKYTKTLKNHWKTENVLQVYVNFLFLCNSTAKVYYKNCILIEKSL